VILPKLALLVGAPGAFSRSARLGMRFIDRKVPVDDLYFIAVASFELGSGPKSKKGPGVSPNPFWF